MIMAYDYFSSKYLGRRIILRMKDGTIEEGKFLDFDDFEDNDIGDGFVLDVNGDETIGRLILEKDVERVEFED